MSSNNTSTLQPSTTNNTDVYLDILADAHQGFTSADSTTDTSNSRNSTNNHDNDTDVTTTTDISPDLISGNAEQATVITDPEPATTNVPLQTSARERKTPSHLNDYYCYLVTSDVENGVHYPISKHLSYHNINAPFKRFIMSVTSNIEPRSF
jgi:hypothetical protein